VTGWLTDATRDAFAASRARFATMLDWLDAAQAGALTHAELEDRLDADGRGLLRQLLQDHLDLRAARETRTEVIDAHGMAHGAVEAGHTRRLATVFGEVDVTRLAYRRRGHPNLHPADATLNLPGEKHSHGLRRLAAIEAARGSFDAAITAIQRATGQSLGKRQVEQLAARAAVDFDDFYAHRPRPPADPYEVLVVSCDGKGIVMRPDALRAATAKAAAAGSTKLATRLSKGEKRNRKRMATVAAVYDLTPVPRTTADVMSSGEDLVHATPAPKAANKWLMASVVDDAASVVAAMFDEADRRDPDHARTWIALVDGNNHQIDRINTEARNRAVPIRIVIDLCRCLHRSTSYTSLNTCGVPPGASSTKATPPLRTGSPTKPCRFCAATPPRWPPPSGERPPPLGSPPTDGPTPTPAQPTCSANAPTSTTPTHSSKAGPSPPASSKAPAATS
jgi:hypothetical protein